MSMEHSAFQWSGLFESEASSSGGNKLHQIKIEVEDEVLKVPKETIGNSLRCWKDKLVGFFKVRRVAFLVVKKALELKWKLKAPLILSLSDNLFYMIIEDEDVRRSIVEGGPVFIGGKDFAILPWSE